MIETSPLLDFNPDLIVRQVRPQKSLQITDLRQRGYANFFYDKDGQIEICDVRMFEKPIELARVSDRLWKVTQKDIQHAEQVAETKRNYLTGKGYTI